MRIYCLLPTYVGAVVKYTEKTPRAHQEGAHTTSGQYLHFPVMEMVTVSHDDADVMCSHGVVAVVELDVGDVFLNLSSIFFFLVFGFYFCYIYTMYTTIVSYVYFV